MTPKQERFVEEYLIDLNATQAAIRAGYSVNGAEVTASKLLRNANVASAVAKAQKARSERTGIDAEWVLARLAAEATADVNDLYADNGALKPVSEWPLIWRQGLVSGMDVSREKDGDGDYATVTKLRLSDRIKRLELIGKHVDVQAFAERKEITGANGGPIEISELSDVERAQRLASILRKS